MGLKKRQMRILFLMLISIFAYTTWFVYSSQDNLSNDDFIRFHVIANSDTVEDQQLKLKVRDAILAKVNNELVQETMARHNAEVTAEKANYSSESEPGGESEEVSKGNTTTLDLESSRAYILNNLPEIEKAARQVIIDNGYDYNVKAELGIKWIPEKTYGEVTFPAGNYEALNIIIGDGKGQNWWCVLFPPLCLIGVEDPDGEKSEENQEIYKEVIVAHKYDPITHNNGEPTTLKLKFKTLELVDELNK